MYYAGGAGGGFGASGGSAAVGASGSGVVAQAATRSGAISPDDIILTASSSESYRLLFDQLCEPGDSVLLPCPGYPLFEQLAAYSRVRPEFYQLHPEDGWLPDPAGLDALMASLPRARAIVLISPNNPSGAIIDDGHLAAIRTAAGQHGVVVILDEVFREFVYEPQPKPAGTASSGSAHAGSAAARGGNGAGSASALLVRINGISKMFACPDIKLGWIAIEAARTQSPARDELVQQLEIAADVYLSASGPAQHLVPALFAEGMGFIAEMKAELSRRRKVLLDELAGLRGLAYVPPAGGIHCIVEIPGLAVDDEELAVKLVREEGLYVHPGYLYGIQDRTALVLSFLSHPEDIREGVARLRRLLRRL
ncbi:MAG: pyridoxal phosphate-dependent aminotransferase [Spirochaeta sp.]|nr:pyridoxal phosphate-dependent aminotransferase [Spirochaeta sp.]